MTEEAPNPAIPRVNSELLEKVRGECKTLRFKNLEHQRRSTPAIFIAGAGMVAFVIIIVLTPTDQNRVYYQTSSFAIFLGSLVVGYAVYYYHALQFKLKPNQRWALLAIKVYEDLTSKADPDQVRTASIRALNLLIRDIRREWDIKENPRYSLGYLIDPGLKFIDRLDKIGQQIKKGEEHHWAEAQIHLVNLTNFFLYPSEEEFQKILSTKVTVPISKTVTLNWKILSNMRETPRLKRLRVVGCFGAGAVATYFIALRLIGIGNDTSFAVAAAVALSYFAYEFKKK